VLVGLNIAEREMSDIKADSCWKGSGLQEEIKGKVYPITGHQGPRGGVEV
jgi:hypothetical protein